MRRPFSIGDHLQLFRDHTELRPVQPYANQSFGPEAIRNNMSGRDK